jgi:hypothetical protein
MRPIFITIEQRLIAKQNFIEIQPNKQYKTTNKAMVVSTFFRDEFKLVCGEQWRFA